MKTNNILYCIFLSTIILAFSYYNSQLKNKEQEKFTQHIRKIYRPHIRNARLYYSDLYDKTTNQMTNMFRKTGLF